jgi:hypothetical protein
MATVGTSTQTDVLAYPVHPAIARDMSTGSIGGRLYSVIRTAADTLTVYRSTDAGGSWSSWASFTHTGLQEWSRLIIDRVGYGHIAYRVGTGSADTIWYRRVGLLSASFTSGLQCSNTDANGGTIGSRWQGVDLAVARNSDGSYAIAVGGAHSYSTSGPYGIIVNGVTISPNGVIALNNGIIVNNRGWNVPGTPPGRSGIAMEVEHNGDGFTSTTPHLWICWGRTTLRQVKLAWQGAAIGWSGPSNHQIIRTGLTAHNYVGGRWDGRQWLMAVVNPDDATTVRVYQRNQANSLTTVYDTPTHPTGTVTQMATSYDNATKDIRVYAVGTSTAVLYYCDYTRATGVWTAWATVVATAVLGSSEWSVRGAGSYGNAKLDVLTTASGSPNTVTHTAQAASSVPNIASWNTSGQPYADGGAADVGAALTLDWDFSDPDPGQTQGSYALSRQIGVAAVQYYTAAGATWGGTEVQNSTATTQVTLASGWGSGTDAVHTYKVKVWDSTSVPAVAYSSALTLIPSVKVNPTITAPTAAQVINGSGVVMTWTVSEQTTYRVRLLEMPSGLQLYSSDDVAGTVTSYAVPYELRNDGSWRLELRTKNNEGLLSNTVTVDFTTVYAAPPAPISTLVASTTGGTIGVTSSALTPVGSQPAIVAMDLYRRKAATPVLNTNPGFAGNVTGWQVGGGGTPGTLTYSTVQFHDGPGAARYVPAVSGGSATPSVEQSTNVLLDLTKQYLGSAWIRPDTANKPAIIYLNWYTSAGAYISSTTMQVTTPVAGAWQYLEVRGDPSSIATAARATVSAGVGNTPASTDAFYLDEVELEVYDPDPGVRVAAGVNSPAVVADWGPASGVDYEYRWTARGSNGTTVTGPWTS